MLLPLIAGCAHPPPDPRLVGVWDCSADPSYELEFQASGRGAFSSREGATKFSWSIQSGALKVLIVAGDTEREATTGYSFGSDGTLSIDEPLFDCHAWTRRK